jgi:hypothetical protein
MRKRIGAIVLVCAAAATMAFGAGSASAATTTICETNSSPFACAHPYPNSSHFVVVGKANFESSSSGFSCPFEYEFELGANKKPVVQARMLWWEFSPCTGGHIVSSLPSFTWAMRLTTTGTGPNGTGEIEPWLFEPFDIDGCDYEVAASIPLKIEGGGWITTPAVSLTRVGAGSCPPAFGMGISSSKPVPMFWMTN